jgi:prolyl-tRNA synthetase
VKVKDQKIRDAAFELYEEMKKSGLDVLIDDRESSFGAKMADADLLGIPVRVVVGEKSIQEGKVEVKARWSEAIQWFNRAEAISSIKGILEKGIS